jgi:hypothetical protein
LKSLFAILFLSAVLWQPFYQSGYIAYWQINKDRIAKTECINRFKPMMHCNGKCQLYRELKKAADEEAANNKLPVAVLKLKTLDTFIELTADWQSGFVPVEDSAVAFYTPSESLLPGISNSLLKPPQILA